MSPSSSLPSGAGPLLVRRRSVLAGLAALGAVPALAACGEESSASSGRSGKAEPGALPVSIRHKFGTTRITKAPSRVVCVGLTEQDALLALGVVPVATSKWFGKAPGQVFSWAKADLGDAKVPTVLDPANGIPIEKVAGLAPDLIIGQYSGMKKSDYDKLSRLAPTIAQSGDYVEYGMPWDEATQAIAAAVGRPRAGRRLVTGVKSDITDQAKAHPEFQGRTAVCITPYEGIYVYGPQDPRGRMLADLGFTFPQQLDKPSAKEFGWSFSTEKTALLDDVDAVVWLGTEQQVAKGTGGLWARTKAAREGRGIFISEKDGDFYIGQSMVTPLSIPWVLERYVPQLVAAVDGRTSTKVPAPTA